MRRVFCALALLLVPRLAGATSVLCYGDSITALGYPGSLAALRPDLTITNGGVLGDSSKSSARLAGLLRTAGPFDVTVILIGTNDPLVGITDPAVSARGIRNLARVARTGSSRVIVLTLLPSPRIRPLAPSFDFDSFTRDVSHALQRLFPDERSRVRVADARGALSVVGFANVTDDGLHLTANGNALLARYVSDLIP